MANNLLVSPPPSPLRTTGPAAEPTHAAAANEPRPSSFMQTLERDAFDAAKSLLSVFGHGLGEKLLAPIAKGLGFETHEASASTFAEVSGSAAPATPFHAGSTITSTIDLAQNEFDSTAPRSPSTSRTSTSTGSPCS